MRSIKGLMILMILFSTGCSSAFSQSADEKVEDIVTSYLEALETGNVETMVEHTSDLRFPDKDEQLKEYASIDDDITNTNLVDIRKVSNNEYETTVEVISNKKFYELTLPIQLQDNKWRIIVGQDL